MEKRAPCPRQRPAAKRSSCSTSTAPTWAATVRHGPWFLCALAYTAPVANSRWYQDRQNLVSIYHDKTGLILGGGNTKLQPGVDKLTVGNMALLGTSRVMKIPISCREAHSTTCRRRPNLSRNPSWGLT